MSATFHAPALLGVAIVSWNVSDLLRRCLKTVRQAELGDTALVVVVDNASSDGTPDMMRERFPDVTLIENDGNLGFTRANNQALAALGVLRGDDGAQGALWDEAACAVIARERRGGTDEALPPLPDELPDDAPDYVLLLNPDTEVSPDALAKLRAVLDEHPRCACVGPMLRYGDGTLQSSRRLFPSVAAGLFESTPVEWHWPNNPVARRYRMGDADPSVAGEVDWVVGAAMMLRTRALQEVGGLDEGFFMYSEEVDLCRRLADAGWVTRYEPSARVVHHEGRSSDQVVPARHRRFMRSRVRYFRKHHRWPAATLVRLGLLSGYFFELVLELSKWLMGHKRQLRAERVKAYLAILRDGLG